MAGPLNDRVGFERPNRRTVSPRRQAAALELMATIALVISTVVAATVVSIGIARADVSAAGAAAPVDASLALAVLLGLVLGGWGWLTVAMTRDVSPFD